MDNQSFRATTGSNLAYLYVYMQNTYANTCYFDNIKVYHSTPRMKTAVDRVTTALETSGFASISSESADTVKLPFRYETKWGSTVLFSDEKGIVSADGRISTPFIDTEDVLTITVKQGEYAKAFLYPITILGRFYAGDFVYENTTPILGINNVQINLYSNSGETMDVHLVVAAYESGMLMSLAIEKYSITANQGTAKAGVMISKVTENTVVKAFIIEDFTTMRPIK